MLVSMLAMLCVHGIVKNWAPGGGFQKNRASGTCALPCLDLLSSRLRPFMQQGHENYRHLHRQTFEEYIIIGTPMKMS